LKIEVRENYTVGNYDILLLKFMECINTINIYEIFNNNIHLLNMLYEGRPDLSDGIDVNGGTLYLLENIYALYEGIYDIEFDYSLVLNQQ
jgi:hypothetical protein